MNIKEWLINWFEKNSDLNRIEIEKSQDEDYLSKSWIDSFKFISLIDDIEQKFNITFLNNDFQKKSFATISGLTTIIEEKID